MELVGESSIDPTTTYERTVLVDPTPRNRVRRVPIPLGTGAQAGGGTGRPLASQDPQATDNVAGYKYMLEEQRRAWDETARLRNAIDERHKVLFAAAGLVGPVVTALGVTQFSSLAAEGGVWFWGLLAVALVLYFFTLISALVGLDTNLDLIVNPTTTNFATLTRKSYGRTEAEVIELLIQEYTAKNEKNTELVAKSRRTFQWARRAFYIVLALVFGAMITSILRTSSGSLGANTTPTIPASTSAVTSVTSTPTISPTPTSIPPTAQATRTP